MTDHESFAEGGEIDTPDLDGPTTTLSGHIVSLTDDIVTIRPELDDPRVVEIKKENVIDFAAHSPMGRCDFVVPASVWVEERVTVSMTERRRVQADEVPLRGS